MTPLLNTCSAHISNFGSVMSTLKYCAVEYVGLARVQARVRGRVVSACSVFCVFDLI